MFERTFVTQGKTRRGRSVAVALILQLIVVGIIILIPLVYFQQLPEVQTVSSLVAPPPPPPPPPPPAAHVSQPHPVKITPVKIFNPKSLTIPKTVPKVVANIQESELTPPTTAGVPGGVPAGVEGAKVGGVLGGVIEGVPTAAPSPPPPPKPEAAKPTAPANPDWWTGGSSQADS